MISRVFAAFAVVASIALSGCGNMKQMAFSENLNAPLPKDKAIVLMTASMRNDNKVSFQPKILSAIFEKGTADKSSDSFAFKTDPAGKIDNQDFMRMELENGTYVLRGMPGHAMAFPINGFYFAPVHAELSITAPGVYYIGHVEAVIRDRNGSEFKAGPSIPLIDQAIAGASTGSFDIKVSDNWDKDEKTFRSNFPSLKDVEIKKAILPAFDRARAQKYWEDH